MTGQPAPVIDSAPSTIDPGTADTGRQQDRWGWAGVAAITAMVAVAWAPYLNVPFGDNHLGRIIGRYALHLRNLQEQGLVGSNFSADWAPYSEVPYAHHPPLLNMLVALFGGLPGEHEYEVWLPPYLLALLVIPAGAALLRGFRIGWPATLLALLALISTTFFWIYSPLMFDLGPILAVSAAAVQLRQRPDPPRWLVVTACVAALLATLVSWPGIGFAAAMGLWLFAKRRRDRVTVAIGASMVAGVAVSLLFVVGVSGMADLSSQAEFRTAGGEYTARQFVSRQWSYLESLLPLWYLILLPIGVVAGLLVRRTRLYMTLATGFTAGWVIVLNNGAYIHSYWTYPVLILGLVGIGLILDRVFRWLPTVPALRVAVPASLAALLLASFAVLVLGPVSREHLSEPADAGEVAAAHQPPAGQRYAWVVGGGVASPRWLVYYWQLWVRVLADPQALTHPDVRPEDLVLMDVRQRPGWVPATVLDRALGREGHYVVFRVADLQAVVPPPN